MEFLIKLDASNFYARLAKLYTTWSHTHPDLKALAIINGKHSPNYTTSSLIHYWLVEYEFTETFILLTQKEVVILTSKKKKEIFE